MAAVARRRAAHHGLRTWTETLRPAVWLGVRLRDSWAVRLNAYAAPRFTEMPAREDGRCLSLAGDELLIDSRDLVAEAIDENVELTRIVVVRPGSLHEVRALVL